MESCGSDGGSPFGDIPSRPMRVKVLYTFDAENKTTCLARFPETLNIPTVSIDKQSQVGVIDLRQCVQAIMSASPEILSRLDTGDFTIYAFDYSEHDTPLVGQGRLSSLLDTTPSTHASSQSGQNMITGRVCQNVPALFSNGVKETLEVKLRLTPVSKPTQNEYTRTMENFRSMSPATSAGFDPNAWNASLQHTKAHQHNSEYFDFNTLPTDGDDGTTLLDHIFGIESGSSGGSDGISQPGGVGVVETPTDATFAYNPAFSAHAHSAPGSRSGSPIIGHDSTTRNEHLRHQSFSGGPLDHSEQSRPGSRASIRSEVDLSTFRSGNFTSSNPPQSIEQPFDVFYNEDGQARKRAKVTQTDWRGRSSFGSRSSDLRVAASKAASMHMHRPVARRPNIVGNSLEPPPRVPTPVPRHASLPHQRSLQSSAPRSMLRQASVADSDLMSDCEPMSDASPEGVSPGESNTAEGTPVDIPSSPPIVPGYNHPQPSSPGLPAYVPRIADSGYMSERGNTDSNNLECMEDNGTYGAGDEMEGPSQLHSQRSKQQTFVKSESPAVDSAFRWPESASFTSEMNVRIEEPGDMNQLPQKMLLNIPPPKRDSSQGPRQQRAALLKKNSRQRLTSGSPPAEVQTPDTETAQSRRGSLALPPKALDSAPTTTQKQKRQSLHRSGTFNDSEAGSPAPSDNESRPKGPNRSGSGAHRRKVIEQRLQDSIARGEMPQYCAHCGAIETPTWRRLYVKYVDGKPGALDSVEGEGETIGVESVKTDEVTGEVTRFVIRKSMKKTKDSQPGPGFADMMVCNPCGLWFNKFRQMRPSDKWGRKAATRRSKKPKRDDGIATDGLEPPSEAMFTDQVGPEDTIEDPISGEDSQHERASSSESLPAQARRPRANSLQSSSFRPSNGKGQVTRSLSDLIQTRAIQSSPIRLPGSQGDPIEVDLTPKPTRRLLFPSPRRSGEVKSLDCDQTLSSDSNATDTTPKNSRASEKIPVSSTQADLDVFGVFTQDKENMFPPLEMNDELSQLFEGSPEALFRTPVRKTPSKRSPLPRQDVAQLPKTPTPTSRKRKALGENPNAANESNANVNDFMTSPSSTRYFLRSTPSRLERTPGRRSASGSNVYGNHDVSPFSHHLAQMLSDGHGQSIANFTSPNRQFDFSDLPTFNTPGREMDWKGLDEILSSDFAAYEEDAGMAVQNSNM